MEKQQLENLKQDYIDSIKLNVVERGGMFSHIALIGSKKDTDQAAIVHVVVENEFMDTLEGKEIYATKVLPKIANELKEQFTIESAVWTSEAWLRTTNEQELKSVDNNWQRIPIKMEVLIMTFRDSDDTSDSMVFQIKRNGKKVTDEGDLIDNVQLIPVPEYNKPGKDGEGRLNDMLKLFF